MDQVNIIRRKCVEQLEKIIPQNYTVELEARIFEISGKPSTFQSLLTSYFRKYCQLVYDLKRHGAYLVSRYSPSELVFLRETDLNPDVKREVEEITRQNETYKQILLKGVEDDEGDASEPTEGGNKCSKCKNTKNISIMLQQLRSGDEPMSCFFTCNSCGHKWRVG